MEERPVDIFGFDESESSVSKPTLNGSSTPLFNHSHQHTHPQHDQINGNSKVRDEDEDYLWADDDPDDDLAGWRLRILIEEDDNTI